jgi:lipoprotein-anchoring transpeptidase ErfK/SrfK
MQARPNQSESRAARFIALFLLTFVALRESRAQTQPAPQIADEAEYHHRIVVSIPHRKLALIEDGKVRRIYPVAVGAAESPSPTGSFEIKTRLVKPTYYHPGKVIPAGAANPLGTRWIGLTTKGYGIHGTNIEASVGKAASHGCIRMHRKDLEQLFASVQVGDRVEIRDNGDEELASIFGELPDAVTSTEETATAVTGQ